ncbi:MAG: S9 family peptidase [Bacteroidales bacterium]|nr:S9 family peptidase [Bacteroidales bacterium]
MKQLRFLVSLAVLLLAGMNIYAQQKSLAITDLMSRKLYPQSLVNLQWRDNDIFTWVAGNSLVSRNVKADKADTLLTLSDLNEGLKQAGIEALKGFPAINWKSTGSFTFGISGKLISFSLAEKKAVILNTFNQDAENQDIEPATGNVAFTSGNNLYVSVKGEKIAVTNDENKDIVNGQSVHRNEFGISKGTFWSPKGNLLAFYRMDQTMVTDYPLVDIDERIATVKNIKYPMAGMASHHVTVGVYDPQINRVVYLQTGEPAEQYLTNISWSPDEKSVYIAVLNRDQDHMWLRQYDANTGAYLKTLFEETDKQYVEPVHPMHFLKTNPNQFIWQSRSDGWNHLYLYNTDGTLINQLTSGNWEVTDFEGTDEKEEKVFFLSTEVSALERQLFSVEINGLKKQQLTQVSGTHSVFISPDGKNFIDRLSSVSVGSKYTLQPGKVAGGSLVFQDLNPLKDYSLGETRMVTLIAEDGRDLYARMITPVGFDPSKKYPVLIYVYGGPHSQLVTNSWLGGAGLFLNYMASKGYIVFTLDNHGTANRGTSFEQSIHRQLGVLETADQMKGVGYLKSLPYVDATRIGLDGWSYGGFLTLTLKLKHPGVFKVASCGGPVVDWKYYEIMYGERYMDTPEQNPDGYKQACLLNYADKLEGKLLVIHGGEDNTVVWQNSLKFVQQCILSGKQLDYFVYPNHEHNVSGKDRLHLYRKIAEYYEQNL